ncbi:hypothetical protein [Flavobacterium sp. LHD-85]|uniref:hypothetical protein n=1 Tax=Flavobacterium sp. LHD-85 TaxID=3071410 RepID=UPI0027E19276|nr:hypothetical protein [Flavobacterium sp. LHD-85]MDQ6528403.1 hypothetical protein [Flavobacterium sp. LHD-85]
MQNQLVVLFLLFGFTSIFAQGKDRIISNDSLKSETIDPLRPAKAAFYSAVLPGLG